jgi:hypothetical protein
MKAQQLTHFQLSVINQHLSSDVSGVNRTVAGAEMCQLDFLSKIACIKSDSAAMVTWITEQGPITASHVRN